MKTVKYLIQTIFISLIISLIFPSHSSAFSVTETDIFDNFSTDTNFSTSISGDYRLASYAVKDSSLIITHQPRNFYNSFKVSKTYQYDISQPTWFHFRFKMEEHLMGQDMYTTFTFYKDNDASQPLNLTVGINSEQHWKTNYFSGRNIPCESKSADDEFFIAVSEELFPNATDVRLRYPTGYTNSYTDWILFSVKYDQGLFSFYIDGYLVDDLHSLDRSPTSPPIDPSTTALNSLSLTDIKVTMTSLTDGREYSYTGNKYGIRGRGCYTPVSPAIPSTLTYPDKFNGNDGLEFKSTWMKQFDAVATIMVDQMRALPRDGSQPTLLAYQPPQSALTAMHTLPTTNPTQFYTSIPIYINDNTNIRSTISTSIWNDIYNGDIDLATAIEMGAIPLPDSSHSIWTNNSSTLRQEIIDVLTWQENTYHGVIPLAKSFVWKKVFSIGGVPDIVHFGYLTPEDAYSGNAVNNLSEEAKNTIPRPAQPKNSIFSWDFFLINRNMLSDDLAPDNHLNSADLNQDGQVDIFDYNILVAGYGTDYNIFDYNQLVANYGSRQ